MGRYALIKEAAERKKTSINKMEKDLGLPKGSISKYDKNVPSIATIAKIANYLETSIDSLTPESDLLQQSTERFRSLLKKNNISSDSLCDELGFPKGSLFDWDAGLSQPDSDMLLKIAEYFGVTTDWLLYGTSNVHKSASGKEYYFDDQTAEIAQELFDNPQQRLLFHNTRNMPPEDLNALMTMVEALRRKEKHE